MTDTRSAKPIVTKRALCKARKVSITVGWDLRSEVTKMGESTILVDEAAGVYRGPPGWLDWLVFFTARFLGVGEGWGMV